MLTAAAAVLAMIPLSRSVFWGPMAVAIMGGLIVATALTLLALPAMYAAWFRVKREPGSGLKPGACASAKARVAQRGELQLKCAVCRLRLTARAGGEIGRRTRFRS